MGWELAKVERYAGPPLAERGYIADRAQSVDVRSGVSLAASSQAVLEADGVDPDSVEWDSWRRDDAKWIVTVSYARGAGNARASWTFDNAGRNLHPLDETARHLMGVNAAPAEVDEIDEIDFITEDTTVAVVDDSEIIETLRQSQPLARPHLVAVPSEPTETITIVREEIIEVIEVIETEEFIETEEIIDTASESIQEALDVAAVKAPAKKVAKPKAKGRRASVPSWDEILFGATRGDDQ